MAISYLESLLGEREKINLTARQHWFILLRSIALEIILILLIFAATVTAAVFLPQFLAIIVVIGFGLLLIPIFTMTMDILNYTNRLYVITNRRVIQLSGVFNKNITDSNLEKVNDIHMAQSALGRMFDYGDIEILTASELGVNLFKRIENPIRFKKALLNAKTELEGYGLSEDLREAVAPPAAPALATDGAGVPALIGQLDNLRQQGLLTEEEFQQKKAQLLDRI